MSSEQTQAIADRALLDVLIAGAGRRRRRGAALARPGVRDAAQYLVRPDGHVGYRCAGTNVHDASGYLARWLGSTTPTSALYSEE